MKFFLFILIFIALCMAFHLITKRYLNPYQLIMIFGKKGSGKSTLLTKKALRYMKQGYTVFTNTGVPGTFHIDASEVGYFELPRKAVLMIDEAGMIWDNRDFKKFDNKVRDWYKLQRHRKLKVYLFSQTFDVDKKIRDLTDSMFLVEKKLRVFSYAKRINKHTVLNESTSEAPSKLDENLQFDSFLFFWAGSRAFTFIPKYIKYFDSYESDPLPTKEFYRNDPSQFKTISKYIEKSSFSNSVYPIPIEDCNSSLTGCVSAPELIGDDSELHSTQDP